MTVKELRPVCRMLQVEVGLNCAQMREGYKAYAWYDRSGVFVP